MDAVAQRVSGAEPEWLGAEMPPGYQNRLAEIERLMADLRTMGRFGRLLWQAGDELSEAVRDAFAELRFEVGPVPGLDDSALAVRLDPRRRLLLHVSGTTGTIQKKHPELAQVFKLLQEVAGDANRVVLVANSDPDRPPAARREPLESEALSFLGRMGANVVAAPTLFALWTLSLQDRERARGWVERLHAQDGGAFVLPALRKD